MPLGKNGPIVCAGVRIGSSRAGVLCSWMT